MTTERESIKKSKTKTETLKTCDFCDLSEEQIDRRESIVSVTVNPKIVFEGDDEDKYLGSIGEHKVWPQDGKYGFDTRDFGNGRIELASNGQIDFCTHCLETLLG